MNRGKGSGRGAAGGRISDGRHRLQEHQKGAQTQGRGLTIQGKPGLFRHREEVCKMVKAADAVGNSSELSFEIVW